MDVPAARRWLKPLVSGQRVNLERVDRMTLTLLRRGDEAVRWCLTPFVASSEEPRWISSPVLPKGKLLDEIGQSMLRDWPGKTHGVADVTARLNQQLGDAALPEVAGGFLCVGRLDGQENGGERVLPLAKRRQTLVAGRPRRMPLLVGRDRLR